VLNFLYSFRRGNEAFDGAKTDRQGRYGGCGMIPATRNPVPRSPALLFGVFFLLFMTLIILFRVSDADAARESKAMTITYKNDHFAQLGMDFRLIYATGLFVKGTTAEFRLFVERNKIKDGAVVILESDGAASLRPSAWVA
jgi:hypothetical protein